MTNQIIKNKTSNKSGGNIVIGTLVLGADIINLVKSCAMLLSTIITITLLLFLITFVDKFAKDIWSTATTVVGAVAGGVKVVAETQIDVAETVGGAAINLAQTAGNVVGETVSTTVDMLDATIGGATSAIGGTVDAVSNATSQTILLTDDLVGAFMDTGEAIGGLVDGVTGVVNTAISGINALENTVDVAMDVAQPMCEITNVLAGTVSDYLPGPDLGSLNCNF